jgi:hypothetical protein
MDEGKEKMLDTLASLEKGDRILFVSWNDERYG